MKSSLMLANEAKLAYVFEQICLFPRQRCTRTISYDMFSSSVDWKIYLVLLVNLLVYRIFFNFSDVLKDFSLGVDT